MKTTSIITLVLALAGLARADPPARPPVAPAAAPPASTAPGMAPTRDAAPRSLVVHVAPLESDAGAAIELVAQIDAPFAEALTARWRVIGEASWRDATFERSSAGGWYASLPDAAPPGIEYFIRGRDTAGVEVAHFASEQAPHVVRVVPRLYDRLEDLDVERLGGRRNEISLDVIGHNFGNRYDLGDRFVRAELVYTRRLLRHVHHVSFGFGSISGTTPLMSLPEGLGGSDIGKSLRYGFGEVRLRAHPSVFVDMRGSVGASHEGFQGGVRGAVTFGKPWRSSVSVGGEYLGHLGPTAWVRLQWDTAPPLLMGASIVRTDLPGAVISSAGLYIAYDVAYRVAERLAVRAQLSYGSRDGISNFGGGVGTAVDF